MSSILVVAHNEIAYNKFIKPYLEGECHHVVFYNNIVQFYLGLMRIILTKNIDMVVTQHPLMLIIFPLVSFYKVKWIHFVTGQVWCLDTKIKNKILEYIERKLLSFPDYNICDSFGQYQFLSNRWKGLPSVHYTGIGSMGGVDLNTKFKLKELANDKINLSWIGRNAPDKNFNMVRQLMDQVPDKFKLHVYGFTGNNTSNIIYHGFTEDICKSLTQDEININIVTSKREGFCLVILESISIGIPTISSRIYGTDEIISAIKMNEYQFSPDSIAELRHNLIKFCDDYDCWKEENEMIIMQNISRYERGNVVSLFKKFIGM